MTHRERMIERRARQLARTPGFDPVPNKRIEKSLLERLAAMPFGIDPVDAFHVALHQIASKLPPLSLRHRAPRTSKSDCAAYRKAGPCDCTACPA